MTERGLFVDEDGYLLGGADGAAFSLLSGVAGRLCSRASPVVRAGGGRSSLVESIFCLASLCSKGRANFLRPTSPYWDVGRQWIDGQVQDIAARYAQERTSGGNVLPAWRSRSRRADQRA